MRATSLQRPGAMFLLSGIQRKRKRPVSLTCLCAIGAEFWTLRTDTLIVREQNSITGQLRPRTVWIWSEPTTAGSALILGSPGAAVAIPAAVVSEAITATVRAVEGRIGSMLRKENAEPHEKLPLGSYIACRIYN